MKGLFVILLVIPLFWSCDSFEQEKKEAQEIAEEMSLMISAIESYAKSSVETILPFFQSPEQYSDGLFDDAVYEFYDGIIYHNPDDQGYGKFFYSGYYPVGDEEKRKVKVLEHMIPHLQRLIEDSEYSEYMAQSYVITYDTLIVFYPWSDLISFIPPGRNIMDRRGWKSLNKEANPRREFQWTPPYVDTTGKGFVVDIIIPIDNGPKMEAFLGIDITISTLKEKFFDTSKQKLLLIDKNTSQLFAISSSAEELLGVENAEAFRYLSMIDNSEVNLPVMPDNLILNRTSSKPMKEIWDKIETEEQFEITVEKETYRTYRRFLEAPSWYLLLLE